MGASGGRGARICLAAAAAAAAAALVVAALRGDAGGAAGPGRDGGDGSAAGPARTALDALPGPRIESAPAPAGAGPRKAAPDAPPEADFVVTARDATTGERVLEFWVERGGVRDLAAPAPAPLARSDPESGRARLERRSPPSPLRVRARRYSVWRGMEPEPPGRRVVASLERATTFHGFVRDASGAPIVGARVELEFFGAGPEGLASDADAVLFSGATLRSTGEDGSYEFSGLQPGVWRTRVPWLAEASVSTKQVLRPGQWQVADHWLGARTRIVATVTGRGGEGGAPDRVIVTRADGSGAHVASGYTDETGSVTVGPLPAGSYRVSVESAAGEASPRGIEVESSSPPMVTMEFDLGSTSGD